jgi:hypothetical protein
MFDKEKSTEPDVTQRRRCRRDQAWWQAPLNETVPLEWSVYDLGIVGVSRQTDEQEEGPVCLLKSCLAGALVHEIV